MEEETAIGRQRRCKHVSRATNQNATIEELMEAMFSMRLWVEDPASQKFSFPRSEGQSSERVSARVISSRKGVTISRETPPFVEEKTPILNTYVSRREQISLSRISTGFKTKTDSRVSFCKVSSHNSPTTNAQTENFIHMYCNCSDLRRVQFCEAVIVIHTYKI